MTVVGKILVFVNLVFSLVVGMGRQNEIRKLVLSH